MNYQNTKGISSILPMAAVLVLGAAILGYLLSLNERMTRLEQRINQALETPAAIANSDPTGNGATVDKISTNDPLNGTQSVPDNLWTVSGNVTKVSGNTIYINIDPSNAGYDFAITVNKDTEISKKEFSSGASDVAKSPASLSDIMIDDLVIAESHDDFSEDPGFTAQKVSILIMDNETVGDK